MYFYSYRDKLCDRMRHECIDGTRSTHMSRFINHSRRRPNLKCVARRGELWFIALRDIAVDDELAFDYNERRAAVVRANPWLRD